MAKLLRGLFKRGDVFWFQYRVDGVRQRISLHTSDLTEAVSKATKLRVNPNKASGDTVAGLLLPFLEAKAKENRFTEATRRAATGSLNALAEYTDGIAAKNITTDLLQKWYEEMRGEVTESTAQTHLNRARAFFRWAEKTGLINDNPTKRLRIGRLPPPKEKCSK